MVQCVSILGSTGSIGRQSLDIIRRLSGIRCGLKSTSCPDQLARAVQEALEQQ